MFRTADAFGIAKIFLTGYTPSPLDRFKRPVSKIAKAALGAEKTVSWEVGNVYEVVAKLKADKVRIIGLEQDPRAITLSNFVKHPGVGQTALVVGNEVEGIEEGVRVLCDDLVEIPMLGKKESLNVSVATGIALYKLVQK
jgi:tRNA G18 (ribose-2'-O)-methylase SpoU